MILHGFVEYDRIGMFMIRRQKFLVVGGDGVIGAALVEATAQHGYDVITTTRSLDSVSQNRVYLDLTDIAAFKLPPDVDYCFIVAAATRFDLCENDPIAQRINLEYIPDLAKRLLAAGVFVSFISTKSVFGGEVPWPHEDDPHHPGIAYAQQKSEAEKRIAQSALQMSAADRLNVVRFAKVLAADTPPLPGWLGAWGRGEVVEPLSDMIFAPMSLHYVTSALIKIAEARVSGNLHLSGAENISYADFAQSLAKFLRIDQKRIAPTKSVDKGVHLAFKPSYSGMGMVRTTALTGIEPQTLSHVFRDLFSTSPS
jgi:dTDP-4-dehydrorhamnose reductase